MAGTGSRLLLKSQAYAAGALVCRPARPAAGVRTSRPRLTHRAAAMAAAPAAEAAQVLAGTSEEYKRHQESAAKPDAAEQGRTLAALSRTGVVSTFACRGAEEGFPRGSVIEHAIDEQGRPIFSLSTLSAHLHDLRKDGRCSFTVMQPGFKGMNQARITLTGTATLVSESETEAVKQFYLSKNPDSFWVNFGDFSWWRVEDLVAVRYNSGFARAGQVTPSEFEAARPDPVAHFTAPIAKHMNDDHGDQLASIVRHAVPLGGPISKAMMTGLDQYGMDVECTDEKGEAFPCRVPFPRPATDRKDVRTVIVEMTRAAEGASV